MTQSLTSAGFALVLLTTLQSSEVSSGAPESRLANQPSSPVVTTHVPFTPMEAAVDELRRRFPNQIVIGFEELWDQRPESEPHIDLGPPNASLQEVLQTIRNLNPKYRIELIQGGLVHVYPTRGTADPARLLDIKVREFFLPPYDCLRQQMDNYMDSLMPYFSYTPELSRCLWQKKEEWYRNHGQPVPGILGEFMGDCEPHKHRREPIYHNMTVREALNLMALRSLQVAREPTTEPTRGKPKPISWKYRFRRDPTSDTGLGGKPVFQIF